MVILTVWWIGQPMEKKYYLLPAVKVVKQDLTSFIQCRPVAASVEKLPLAYAEFGSYSPDGKQIAVVFRSQVGRNWKRYRGGWKADIHIFNFATKESKTIGTEADAGMNSRCGMAMLFISYPTADQN